jgi:hypothetical protein
MGQEGDHQHSVMAFTIKNQETFPSSPWTCAAAASDAMAKKG